MDGVSVHAAWQSAEILEAGTGDWLLNRPRLEQPVAEAKITRRDSGT